MTATRSSLSSRVLKKAVQHHRPWRLKRETCKRCTTRGKGGTGEIRQEHGVRHEPPCDARGSKLRKPRTSGLELLPISLVQPVSLRYPARCPRREGHRSSAMPKWFSRNTSGLRETPVGTPEFHWSVCWGQQEHTTQDAQKGCPARPQQAKRRGVRFGTLSL